MWDKMNLPPVIKYMGQNTNLQIFAIPLEYRVFNNFVRTFKIQKLNQNISIDQID